MATNLYPQKYINPIDLNGLELMNFKVHKLETLPSVVDYAGHLVAVANDVWWSDGTEWHDLAKLHIDNVHVDSNPAHVTIADFVAAEYTVGDEFNEGDVIVLTGATDAGLRTYIHNGGTAGTTADFTLLPSNVSEAFVRGALSATGAIGYDSASGVFSLAIKSTNFEIDGNGDLAIIAGGVTATELAIDAVETSKIKDLNVTNDKIANSTITESKLESGLLSKVNKNGHAYDLADGEAGVTHTPGTGVYVLNHNFGTTDVALVMRDKLANNAQVPSPFNEATDTNNVTVKFAEQPTNNRYRVSVIPIVFPE